MFGNYIDLEEMKLRRAELQTQIESQEEEKNNLQREIEEMSCKLTHLNDSLAKKIAVRNEYDRTIADTETAYTKVKVSDLSCINIITILCVYYVQYMYIYIYTCILHFLNIASNYRFWRVRNYCSI